MGSVTYSMTTNPNSYKITTGESFMIANPELHNLVIKEIDDDLEKAGKSKKMPEISSGKIVTGTVKVVPTIEKVIFNPPATIVIWSDGLKTVVKAKQKGKKKDKFSEEFGLAMAIAKRYFCGNRSQFLKAVKEAKRFE